MNIGMRQRVVESIRANCESLFPGLARDCVEIEQIRQQRTIGLNITYSPRFVCTVKTAGTEKESRGLFVKCKRDVHKEYENMQMLWTRHYSKSHKYVIPKPLFLDKTNSFLFLERVNGCSLLDGFYGKWSSKTDKLKLLQSRVAGVAHWLVDFQNIYHSQDKRCIPDEMVDFEPNVNGLRGLNSADKRRMIGKMRMVIHSFPEYSETFVTSQFLPRNILFVEDDSKVCVVDFPKLTKGWPMYDFLTFILGIEKLELYPFISRENCENLKEIFVTEYFAKAKIVYDPELIENLWAAYVIADLRRRYQVYKGIRLKGFGNNVFAHKTVRRLADWSKK